MVDKIKRDLQTIQSYIIQPYELTSEEEDIFHKYRYIRRTKTTEGSSYFNWIVTETILKGHDDPKDDYFNTHNGKTVFATSYNREDYIANRTMQTNQEEINAQLEVLEWDYPGWVRFSRIKCDGVEPKREWEALIKDFNAVKSID